MAWTVFDPTEGPTGGEFKPAPRPAGLAGLTVGILENGKRNSDVLLRHLAALLRDEAGVGEVLTVRKASAYRPAPDGELDRLAAKCRAVVTGIGD